jgi:hypothetical protein
MGFTERMFEKSEEVYAGIVRGEVTDVEAALMNAQFEASADDDEDE